MSTCGCCQELEKELELCHEALNRRGMDLSLVVSLSALEDAALAYGASRGDAFCAQRVLQTAIDYAATRRSIDDGQAGATPANEEPAKKQPDLPWHAGSRDAGAKDGAGETTT